MTGNAASLERLLWDGLSSNLLEVDVPDGRFRTLYAASLQRDFDLSNIAEFLGRFVVGLVVGYDRCQLMLRKMINLLPTRSMLCKGEMLDRGHTIACFLRAFHNFIAEEWTMRGNDRSSDPFPIDVDTEPDSVFWVAIHGIVAPVQKNIEFSSSNRFHKCRCGQHAVLGRVLGKRRAVHADRDSSAGEAVGEHVEDAMLC